MRKRVIIEYEEPKFFDFSAGGGFTLFILLPASAVLGGLVAFAQNLPSWWPF